MRLVVAAWALAVVLVRSDEAGACSCVGPHDVYFGPDHVEDAPLNTKVRLEVAARVPGAALLRPIDGTKIATTERTWLDGSLTFVELTPVRALAANIRYEVALVDPAAYPSMHVIGTFKTGAAADTTAPTLDSIGTANMHYNTRAGGGSCSINGPWLEIGPVRASDPGRAGAKLAYAVWMGDESNVDTTKAPTTLIAAHDNIVSVGKQSLCDPHDVPIPRSAAVMIGIAAVDEAGNRSSPRKARVDLRAALKRP